MTGERKFVIFRSLRVKLLALMITLSLIPLAGISAFSYFIGSRQIAGDRIKLSLEKMAQDTADKIDLMLRGKKEEVASMASTFPLIYPALDARERDAMVRLLNNYCFNHEVYDLLLVLDRNGTVVAANTLDRFGVSLFPDAVLPLIGENIAAYPEESALFGNSLTGHSSQQGWYSSSLVHRLYGYADEDVSHRYNIALAEPLRSPQTYEIIGVWISIINWFYIQNILDSVESDLEELNLSSGYAFMFARDANRVIGHKYREAREPGFPSRARPAVASNLYGTRLIEDHGLKNLHDAVLRQERSFAYEYPPGVRKISGLTPINDLSFGWVVGVGIDNADIFRPINEMTGWLAGVTALLAALVVLFTWLIARGITVPVKNLIDTAQAMARGDLDRRVQVDSADEVGILGAAFNDMGQAISEREDQLQDLNRNLEHLVRQRTSELEKSHEALKKAYLDLQSTQEQLVHTEKMASLGQLVAGIAHEIKNPLNFIYGNTCFLADYVQKLVRLLDSYERLPSLSEADRAEIGRLKESLSYEFARQDLPALIDNFTEGARRINNIVSDLRAFSRMDTEVISNVDIHQALEMSLNLLRNQYKDRVEIHREYGEIPKVEGCAGKLSQVFMNLLANAFQAVKEKGDVWIRTRAADGVVEVEIRDNGVGIPRENLTRIFEPFFTTKPVGKGTGLGLSISYGIMEQHRGKISVAGADGGGTVFTVRIPIFQERPAG